MNKAQLETSRSVFARTLNLEKAGRVPAAPHWWGLYKYEATGRNARRDAWQEGEKVVPVYVDFYERFHPDWFHLHIGTPRWFAGARIVKRKDKPVLTIDPRSRALKSADKYFSVNTGDDETIVDFADYLLGSRAARPKVDLSSKYRIDEFVKRYVYLPAEEIRGLGYPDHVARIARRYGQVVFIAAHIPSAVCEIFDPITGYVGFEAGLMAFHDHPKGLRHLLTRSYEAQLEWARAFAAAGAHAYIISESYISPDIANPDIYRKYLKGIHREYFTEVRRLGMTPLCMFWGDVNRILEDLTEINLQGLLVEESKKGFTLDIKSIRSRIGDRVCVFGNVDSIHCLHSGTPDEVRAAALDQVAGARNNFVIANGSPITPGTSPQNVRALIAAAREGRP